jgi:hypothetical protein
MVVRDAHRCCIPDVCTQFWRSSSSHSQSVERARCEWSGGEELRFAHILLQCCIRYGRGTASHVLVRHANGGWIELLPLRPPSAEDWPVAVKALGRPPVQREVRVGLVPAALQVSCWRMLPPPWPHRRARRGPAAACASPARGLAGRVAP